MASGAAHLGEKRQDGDTGVATDDRHRHALRGHADGLCHKGVGAQNVQLRHPQQFAWVVGPRPATHERLLLLSNMTQRQPSPTILCKCLSCHL